MLDEILKVHQAGDLDEAEQRYREWLAFNPDDPEALHLLAILRRQQSDLVEAVTLARRAVELVPDRANYQLTLAGLLLHARDFSGAREGFSTALKLNPNAAGAALGIAQVALLTGDIDAAQDAVSKADRLMPDHPQVFAQKGSIAQARGDHDTAVKMYIEATKRNPNDPAFHANLARSFSALNNIAFAEQALRNAVRLKPDYTIARVALGQLLFKESRHGEALAEFEQVLAGQPAHPLALAGRADIRRANKDPAGALEDLRQAHTAAPDVADIARAYVELLFASGARDEARATLDNALQRSPASRELRRLDLALAMRDGGDAPLQATRDWLQADPANAEARERLATTLELRGAHDEADAIARETLERDSRAAFARMLLARSALRAGRPDDAQEQLNRVPESSLSIPRRIERAQLRGYARDALGDLDGAIEAWLNGQRLQQQLAPLVAYPDVEAITAKLPPPPAVIDGPVPTFLVGLPGAGSESLAAALRQLGVTVLGDRFARRMRRDAITTGEFATLADQLAGDPTKADDFRQRYLAGLAGIDEAISPTLVDWLPFFDLRMAAMIQAAFPAARYLVVARDPRDCLLTWLALGTPQGLAPGEPDAAAAWLANAQAHLDSACARIGPAHRLIVDSADLDDPAGLTAQLAAFLGLAAPSATAVGSVRRGRGGLPTALPDGRWSAYADTAALSAAFARLG